MAYPKPLSEKSLKKMYEESGLSEEKIVFLRNLFESAANLYGVIPLLDLWDVYKEYAAHEETLKIQKKDIFTFSSIARREEHDYSIYEIDELYTEEKRADKDRFLIINEVIRNCNIQVFYKLHEMQQGKPYYVSDDLFTINGPVVSEQEKILKDYLDNLVCTSPIIRNKYNEKMNKPSPHQGKKLKDFEFISDTEKFEIEWLSGKNEHGPKKPQEKKLNEYLKTLEGSYADRIFRDLRFNIFSGWLQFMECIEYFMDHLNEVGVDFTEEEANKLLSMIFDFSNNSHLYVNRGWTPSELSKVFNSGGGMPKTISFGPGIMQAVKEGKISLEELKSQVEAMGLKIQL